LIAHEVLSLSELDCGTVPFFAKEAAGMSPVQLVDSALSLFPSNGAALIYEETGMNRLEWLSQGVVRLRTSIVPAVERTHHSSLFLGHGTPTLSPASRLANYGFARPPRHGLRPLNSHPGERE
jgi:hypothetical protein